MLEYNRGIQEKPLHTFTLHSHAHLTISAQRQCKLPTQPQMNNPSTGLYLGVWVSQDLVKCTCTYSCVGTINYTKSILNKGRMREQNPTSIKITHPSTLSGVRIWLESQCKQNKSMAGLDSSWEIQIHNHYQCQETPKKTWRHKSRQGQTPKIQHWWISTKLKPIIQMVPKHPKIQ